MNLPSIKKVPYDNISMLGPDGAFLSFIDNKKAKWYLKKDLAESEDDKTIKLKFQPKGKGESEEPAFYKIPRANKCVICGCSTNLTKHHVIPYRYRKYFPTRLKSRSSYDVITLCVSDHEKYEVSSTELHKELMDSHREKIAPVIDSLKDLIRVNKAIRKVKVGIVPLEKMEEAKSFILSKHKDVDFNNIEYLKSDLTYSDVHRIIVENTPDLNEFVVMWRKHFVKFTNPQFLPQEWFEIIEIVRKANEDASRQC